MDLVQVLQRVLQLRLQRSDDAVQRRLFGLDAADADRIPAVLFVDDERFGAASQAQHQLRGARHQPILDADLFDVRPFFDHLPTKDVTFH